MCVEISESEGVRFCGLRRRRQKRKTERKTTRMEDLQADEEASARSIFMAMVGLGFDGEIR